MGGFNKNWQNNDLKKRPATPEEQLAKLKERGCTVEDEAFAIKTLTDINYFRLAHYFSLFLEGSGKYREGTSFNRVLKVYDFDRQLRNLLLEILEELEISMRAHCSNFHALKYGALGYLNENTFCKVHRHQQFVGRVERTIETNEDSEMVKHYQNKHGGKFPLWVVMELFSFGSLIMFYRDMKPQDKTEIAKEYYNMTSGALENRMDRLLDLRNHCAHYHRLYDTRICGEDTVFTSILAMRDIYRRKESWEKGFFPRLRQLCAEYADVVELERLGFPEDWEEKLGKS